MFGAALAIAMMGLCTLMFAITRATAVRRTFVTSRHKQSEDLSLLRAVAGVQRLRAAMLAGASLGLAVAVMALPVDVASRVALAVTPLLVFVIGAISAWQLHELARLGAGTNIRVLSHGQYLYAARGSVLVGWVAAPRGIREAASELPRATLHKPGSCARGAA